MAADAKRVVVVTVFMLIAPQGGLSELGTQTKKCD
jgi:hypothetical protein